MLKYLEKKLLVWCVVVVCAAVFCIVVYTHASREMKLLPTMETKTGETVCRGEYIYSLDWWLGVNRFNSEDIFSDSARNASNLMAEARKKYQERDSILNIYPEAREEANKYPILEGAKTVFGLVSLMFSFAGGILLLAFFFDLKNGWETYVSVKEHQARKKNSQQTESK
jgi:hypothetical protein